MVEPYHPYKKPEEVGAESPASGEAKRQSIAGARGGPQDVRFRPQRMKQPPQTSGRRSRRHERVREMRKSFAPEENPALQADEGRLRPGRIRTDPALLGIEPRSGMHRSHGERTEELAQQGMPPGARFAWRGRQHLGRRPRKKGS